MHVSDNIKVIKLNWIQAEQISITVHGTKWTEEEDDYNFLMIFFVWKIASSLMFCFSRFKETFFPKLSMTYSNLVKYTFVNKDETFTFLPTWSLQNLETLLYSLHSNTVSYLQRSIRICSPCNRIHWKHWLYYQSSDWNVIFERDVHRLRYDLTTLRN